MPNRTHRPAPQDDAIIHMQIRCGNIGSLAAFGDRRVVQIFHSKAQTALRPTQASACRKSDCFR